MKKEFKKFAAMLMMVIMIVTTLGATAVAEAGETKEIVEITVMVYDRARDYQNGNTVTENEFTRWINEQLEPQGVHVTYVAVPRSGADDDVNLKLAAGTAPDIIRTYDLARVKSYAQDGGLCDLTEYMDMLDADWLAKSELSVGNILGGQYALPAVNSYGQRSKETFLRQDLVEAVGMEMPTTKEELVAVLYAIKEAYPDMTPYGFGGKITNGNYEGFITAYTSQANERDNYVYDSTFTIAVKPGAKEGIRQLNQFVLDGIIDANFVQDSDNSKYNEGVANGIYAFIADGSNTCVQDAYATASDPNYHMIEVNCMENADGDYITPSSGSWDHLVYVPKTAEDKLEAVMTYLAFLSNEDNAMQVKLGVEGLGYEVVDGVVTEYSRDQRLANGTSADPSDNGFLWGTLSYKKPMLLDSLKASRDYVPEDVQESIVNIRYSGYYDVPTISDPLDADQYSALLNQLIVEFVFTCMCAPEGEFDAVYEEAYQVLLDNHLQDLLDERGAWYDEHIAAAA